MQEEISYKKATFVIMIITLISKVTGFFREILLGSKYGTTYITDAYLISLTIPRMLFASIAAAIATTYIPVYSKIRVEQGQKEGIRFTNKVLNIVVFGSIVLSVFGMIFTRPIVSVIAMGFKGEVLDMAVKFTRLTFPMIIFIGLCSINKGFLQSNNEFTIPALIGIPNNIIIISMLLFSSTVGPYGLVLGTVLGAVVEAAIMVPSMTRKGYRYKRILDFKDPNVIKVATLALPVMLGAAVQQINVFVDRMLASGLPEGSISALNFANRLNGFVYGLFSTSISVVIYPLLSRLNAEEDMKEFNNKLVSGLNVVTLLILPITIGAIVLRQPIVFMLFERGQFDSRATMMTSSALLFYSLGMLFYGYRDILNRTFYSLQDTKTPMINGMITVVINIVLNIILVKYMQHNGLALATSLSSIIMTFLLIVSLRKKMGSIGGRNLLMVFIKSLIASIAMGIVVYGIYTMLSAYLVSSIKWISLLALVFTIACGGLIYFILMYIFKVEETKWLLNMVKRYVQSFKQHRNTFM